MLEEILMCKHIVPVTTLPLLFTLPLFQQLHDVKVNHVGFIYVGTGCRQKLDAVGNLQTSPRKSVI